MRGMELEEEGRISLRMSCSTVTANMTVTLKLSFSPPESEIKKEAKSSARKNSTGSKKLMMYRMGFLRMLIWAFIVTSASHHSATQSHFR